MKMKKCILLLALIVIALIGIYMYFEKHPMVTSESEVAATHTRLDGIKEIGQWAFLTIRDEQLVETLAVEKRIWPIPDKQKRLARIYRGTLCVGFDLKRDVQGDWIAEHGDTVTVRLPRVHLLDDNFLDAANARAVMEEGEWTAADRAALDALAKKKMKAACLTPQKMEHAQSIARQQMETLLKTLGYKVVRIN